MFRKSNRNFLNNKNLEPRIIIFTDKICVNNFRLVEFNYFVLKLNSKKGILKNFKSLRVLRVVNNCVLRTDSA